MESRKNVDTPKISEASEEEHSNSGSIKIEEPKPPDGGWGWVVVFGAIIVMINAQMLAPSFGIMFSTMLRSHKVSSTTISWIFNIQSVVWNVAQLLAGPLSEVFSWRSVAMFGALITTLSVLVSAFATSAAFLYFSYSILGGLGAGLSTAICFFIIPSYFKKYCVTAMSVMLLGSCFGQFLCPIIISYLQASYDFFGATLLLSGVVLHMVVGCALFRPIRYTEQIRFRTKNVSNYHSSAEEISLMEKNKSPEIIFSEEKSSEGTYLSCNGICGVIKRLVTTLAKLTWQNISMIKSFRAIIIAMGISICYIGYLNFNMLVAFSIQNDGYTLEDAAWCTSVSGIGNLIGRIMVLLLSSWPKFNIKFGFIFAKFCVIVGIIGFSFAPSLSWSLAWMSIAGFGIGVVITLYPLIIIDIMGRPLYTQTYGFASVFVALASVTTGPLIGFIRDHTGSYKTSMRVISGLMAASFILWLFMPIAIKFDEKRNKTNKENVT